MEPRVSVCIPTRDRAHTLGEALASVFGQTLADLEVVVYDDGSTDATPGVVAAMRDPRLRYYRGLRRVGVARARNACLEAARGQYVAWLDSDDIYEPAMLARQSAVLDAHPEVGLVHGGFAVIDRDGRSLPDWSPPFAEDAIERGADAFGELVLANYVAAPTVMVRRSCHDVAGPYAEDIGPSSTDWEMWLRIALHADLAYTAAVVARYRVHDESISTATTRSGERLRCDRRVVERVFRRHRALIPDAVVVERNARSALAARAVMAAGDAFTAGRPVEALGALAHVVRVDRSLLDDRHGWLLAAACMKGDEVAAFQHSRAILARLHARLEGTRFAQRIEKRAVTDPEWDRTLERIAGLVRRLVPPGERIAAVDKWDPRLLHLSGRQGWHFPDRRLLAEGYPRDSRSAIEHLEALRDRGARYLVFPRAAFWWLDHYAGLRRHLEARYRSVWSDADCRVYRLSEAAGS